MTAQLIDAGPTVTGQRRSGRLRDTFGASGCRRTLYAALSLPLALGVTGATVMGESRAALGLDRMARRRWLTDDGPSTARASRVLTYGLVSLPITFFNLFVLALMVPNTVRNLAYPLSNPVPADYAHAWGGPTLAGAWTAHALIALALVPVYVVVLRGLVGLQTRLRDALLRQR